MWTVCVFVISTILGKWKESYIPIQIENNSLKYFDLHSFNVILPTPLNGNGPRIAVIRFKYSPKEYHINEIVRYCVAMNEYMFMEDPYACINGLVVIIDFAEATASHLKDFTINFVKRCVTFFESTNPIRQKKLYHINLSKFTYQFMHMIHQYLPEKLKNKVSQSNNKMHNLYNIFDLDLLDCAMRY